MPTPPQKLNDFKSLIQVVKELRGPQGCPWDKDQTHMSLTPYAIEEAHELVEAIESKDPEHIKEELGDCLLQVLLHSEIASQNQTFDIHDVIEGISSKMIRRHPHVFSDVKVKDKKEVWKNWDEIKQKEKESRKSKSNALSTTQPYFDIPPGLPALMTSQKIGHKSNKVRFDWETPKEVFTKVKEEYEELQEAMDQGTKKEQIHELGDLLFSLVQLARHLGFEAEQSLRQANRRFDGRFSKMMEVIEKDQKTLETLSPEQMESFWSKAKELYKD